MTVKQKNKVVLEARGTEVELLSSQVLLMRAGDLTCAGRLDRTQLLQLHTQVLACLEAGEVAEPRRRRPLPPTGAANEQA